MLTSINNDLVKNTVKLQQKKYRDKENKFLLEGFKCVEEALKSNVKIESIFILAGKENMLKGISNDIQIFPTTEQILKKISTTDTAPDIAAVAVKKIYNISDIQNKNKLVLLENIKDMGNLGTIIRTCKAFNAEGIILYGSECADIYNPKCVRSSVGNLWKIPFVYIDNLETLKSKFSQFERIATLPHANNYLKNFKAKTPAIIMFGSEADGLSDELINFSTQKVKIEMSDDVESLNLSVSCAVVLYKIFL